MSYKLTPRDRLKRKARKTARDIIDGLEGRDECIACGYNGYIEVHHIDGDWLNNHPLNLVPLCFKCHKHSHSGKKMMKRLQDMRREFAELASD